MRERSGRQDVTERERPEGLARLASEANATNQSGTKRRYREVGQGSGLSGWAVRQDFGGAGGARISQRSVASDVIAG